MTTSDFNPPLRVVVIEDNRATADSLRHLLDLAGYDMKVAYDGPEGVQLALAWRPDIVLCDIGLPKLDGYDVAITLRQHPQTRTVRLIAVTAYGTDEARKRSAEVGFERHFVKPVDPDVLLEALATQREGLSRLSDESPQSA